MEIIILFFLLLIIAWWFWLYRSQKTGYESAVHQKVKSLLSFSTPARQDETIRLISKFAADFGYRIQYLSQNEGLIILSDVVTAYRPAFYYPVYITQQLHASTEVEVGCLSRSFWADNGKMKKRSHEQCYYSMAGAIMAAGTVVKN